MAASSSSAVVQRDGSVFQSVLLQNSLHSQSDGSFPKSSRLRVRREFLRASSVGTKLSSRHFVLLVSPAMTGNARFGFTVSRKIGNAVVRNRIKRMLRECIRIHKHDWPLNDYVVIARKTSASIILRELSSDLERLLSRVHHQ